MLESDSQLLVSTTWLATHLNAPDVKVIDATWRLPGTGGDPRSDYEAAHIPEARFFDIDEISDQSSPLPHMLPPMEKFVSRVRAMGIGDGHRVVVYDQDGLFSAARVWWMFRVFGHRDVAVLDGGLKKWLAEGRPVEDIAPMPRERHFTGRKDASLVRDVTQVAAALKLDEEQLVDARAPERFRGEAPEPRPGLRAGHMPGAKNLHYATLFNPDGTMRPVEEIRTLFEGAGVDLNRPIITTCGSGVTAAILSLALARIGHRKVALYDGSWSEWGAYPDLEVETG
ncbi:3-mercaptopyruvate sulfurtransferase [Pikeienuella piscinae]|uniref:Sulfurtransferase n=1 Tax=Pikeienuella piscinae TaxID=2748098 RepID=A0A7L5BWE7_9RHOB|nr:3-mercaptopyruvate sulfurtransferase [Pikeienuella piscinae]QIE56205.1 3-mercaptopyruvate sulfurtransferase [Pikeienuella piscinae]